MSRENLLASITHVNLGDALVILVLVVFFWLDYAKVKWVGGWVRKRERDSIHSTNQ